MKMWTRWRLALEKTEGATTLALFRVAMGLGILFTLLPLVYRGVLGVVWLDAADGGYRELVRTPFLFDLVGGVRPTTVYPMMWVAVSAGVLLLIGLGGRITALVALQSCLALTEINGQTGGSYDFLLSNLLWLLVLEPGTRTLSVDCRLREGRWTSEAQVPCWPRYLVVFQLVLMYWSTGLHKVSDTWMPGGEYSALYYILQQPCWHRWDMSWLAWVYPLTQGVSALTWLFEWAAPLVLLALWYRATPERGGRLRWLFRRLQLRRCFVVFGLSMHLFIFISLDVGPFSWLSVACYICLFDPAEWEIRCGRALHWGRQILQAQEGHKWSSSG